MTTFYLLTESYCDCAGSWSNIIESFEDENVANYYAEVFNGQNDCQYTSYYVDRIEPMKTTYDEIIDNVTKYDLEILERYRQWRRL